MTLTRSHEIVDSAYKQGSAPSAGPLKANLGSVREMMAASGPETHYLQQVNVEGGAMMNAGQMRGAVRAANTESAAQLEVIHGLSVSSAKAISQRAATTPLWMLRICRRQE